MNVQSVCRFQDPQDFVLNWKNLKSHEVDTSITLNANIVSVSVGGMDLAERLLQDQKMCQSEQACAGLSDIKLLFSYLQLFQVTDKV